MKQRKTRKDYVNMLKTGTTSLTLAFRASPVLTFIYVVSVVIPNLLPVFQIWVGTRIIDEVIFQVGQSTKSYTNLIIYLAIYLSTELVINGLLTVMFLASDRLEHVLARFAQLELVNKSLALDMTYFEQSDFYNQYSKLRDEIDFRLGLSVTATAQLIGKLANFLAVAVLLVSLHWVLIPLIILLKLPMLVWGVGYSRVSHDLANSLVEEGRKANYLAGLATDKNSIYEIKLFGLGGYLVNKYKDFFNILLLETWKVAKPKFLGAFVASSFSSVAFFVFWLWAISRALTGMLSIGQLVLYIQSFREASQALAGMLRYINELYSCTLYINDFTSFLALKPAIQDKPGALNLSHIESIKFENVWFRYKQDLPYVLEDVSFTINANENIALVGQNGAGKTTIVKLLMRFFDTTDGRILINGKDIKEYKIEHIWNCIGTVFQNFQKYELSARENIAFGQISKVSNLTEVSTAAKKSGAHEFIETFPRRYETILGTKFKNGQDLSVGQWQKIAISRAFIRNSSVMILDEPTAAIDAKSEYEIFKNFIELVEGKITLLISHRFSTVRLADRIFVIENGKIIEKGSHQDLISKNGRYAELFNLQAEGYK